MKSHFYQNQVRLLIDVLPEVEKEPCFAMHGGTAINFFIRNMPRLSVDIDLTYLPIEERRVTLKGIVFGLNQIKSRIKSKIPNIQIRGPEDTPQQSKLFFRLPGGVQIKAEVNTTMRGVLGAPIVLPACFNENEKDFLMNFIGGDPDWGKYGFGELSQYPSLQWKLLNLNKLKRDNPAKFKEQLICLEKILN